MNSMPAARSNGALGFTVIAPGGIDHAGLSILASRWTEALRVNGCSSELALGRARRHPDEGPASEFDDMPRAIQAWCDRASDADRLLVVGLPPGRENARAAVAALASAGSRAALLWEQPHMSVLGLAERLGVTPADSVRVATLNPRFVTPLESQLGGNPVAALPLALPEAAFETRSQRQVEAPFAVAIGRFTSRKGAARLCRTWVDEVGPRLGLRLLMLGSGHGGEDSEEGEVLALADSSPWVECAHIGPLRDRLDRIGAATCVVFAAVDDHLPQALVEALAVEVPVLVTPIPGHLEVVDHGVTGFVLGGTDLGDLAAVIEQSVLGDPAGSRRVARAGADRVRGLCALPVAGRAIRSYLL